MKSKGRGTWEEVEKKYWTNGLGRERGGVRAWWEGENYIADGERNGEGKIIM